MGINDIQNTNKANKKFSFDLGRLIPEGSEVPERFKKAGRTWNPEVITEYNKMIVDFIRNPKIKSLWETQKLFGGQREALVNEREKFYEDLAYIERIINLYGTNVELSEEEISIFQDDIDDLYKLALKGSIESNYGYFQGKLMSILSKERLEIGEDSETKRKVLEIIQDIFTWGQRYLEIELVS